MYIISYIAQKYNNKKNCMSHIEMREWKCRLAAELSYAVDRAL